MRAELLAALAQRIVAVGREPTRVALDGVDAAGKTTLADELASLVEGLGRSVVRRSVDEFHRPRADRYRRGELSPEGYYLDSFDLDAVRRAVLGVTGAAVLLFDGVFLQRPELDDLWDLRVFVDVEPDEALRRALARDGEELRDRYERRYQPAQRLYRDAVRPHERAEIVVENTDPAVPRLTER